jgi:toxin ParE1/3/4
MRRLLITPLAARDLEEISDYIAIENPVRAGSFITELQDQCRRICFNPLAYRQRKDITADVRSCVHGNYVIFFDATPAEVTILRIIHRARDISGQFDPD